MRHVFITVLAIIILVAVGARNIIVLEGVIRRGTASLALANDFFLPLIQTGAGSKSSMAMAPGSLVLSFSLDNSNEQQSQHQLDGIFKSARNAPAIYPGWQVRVYYSPVGMPPDFLTRLSKLGAHVKLINVSELPDWNSYLRLDPCVWKFLVASDPSVAAYAIRDANAVLSLREKAAVDEWLASGKAFHIMRDHTLHHPSLEVIRAGMFGGLKSAVPQMSELLKQFYATSNTGVLDSNGYGCASSFLWKKILPLAKDNSLQHDSYYCRETGGIAFPMTRVKALTPHDFIGDLSEDAGTWGNGRTPSNLPDMQKCLIIEKSRSRYLECLRQRQEMEMEMTRGNITLVPDLTYTGPIEPNQRGLHGIIQDTCKPNHDDEFYSLDHLADSSNSMKSDGLAEAKLSVGGKLPRRSFRQVNDSYTFWSSDFHIAPIADVKDLFTSWPRTKNYRIIDECVSGHCELKETCATNLRVLNRANGKELGACPNELKREFFREYAHDERMDSVDAFLCHHATGLCEVFMAFGRPLIAVVSTRYEIGRTEYWAWRRLNANLVAIASDPRNTIAANNWYDAEYLKHFTGLKEVRMIPNLCGYIEDKYSPSKPEILIGPGRMSLPGKVLRDQLKLNSRMVLSRRLTKAAKSNNLTWPLEFVSIREKYGRFKYSDLAAHPAIVLIPYQVSIMSIFEYYRMGIPMFAPSPDLLAKWQFEKTVMKELTWSCVRKECDKKSSIKGHPDSPHGDRDPNDMSSIENIAYWIKYADFYLLPDITLYNSWSDLFEKITSADFAGIHKRMMAFNEIQKQNIRDEWADILDRAFNNTPPRWQSMEEAYASGGRKNKSELRISWEEAVLTSYPSVAAHTNVTC